MKENLLPVIFVVALVATIIIADFLTWHLLAYLHF